MAFFAQYAKYRGDFYSTRRCKRLLEDISNLNDISDNLKKLHLPDLH